MAIKLAEKSDKWLPGNFNRYIFFKSLLNSAPEDANASTIAYYNSLNALGKHAQSQFNSLNLISQDEQKKSEILTYIRNYIQMLDNLAAKELSQETKYVESLKKEDVDIQDFILDENGKFDYMKFITLINVLSKDLTYLRKTLKTNINNINAVSKKIEDIKEQTVQLKRKHIDGSTSDDDPIITENMKKYLRDKYIEAYGAYSEKMSKLVGDTYEKSLIAQFNDYLNKVFNSLSKDTEFLKDVTEALQDKGVAEGDLSATIQNVCINLLNKKVREENWNFAKVNVKTIADSIKSDIKQFDDLLNKSINDTYSRVIVSGESQISQLLSLSLNNGRGVAAKLEEIPEALDELLDVLKVTDEKERKVLHRKLEKLRTQSRKLRGSKRQKNSKQIEEHQKKVTQGRTEFSKKINNFVRAIQSGSYSDKKTRETIIDKILTNYYSSDQLKNTTDILISNLSQRLSIKASTTDKVGEIFASQDFANTIAENIYKITIMGSSIQYKSDLVFGVSILPLDKQINIKQKIDLSPWVDEQALNQEKIFLENYKREAKGATNPIIAAQEYAQVIIDDFNNKKEFLNSLDDNLKNEAIEYFKSQLLGATSVKTYTYYDNELGFHMGSMGGSGRVVDAIPNILAMLSLGGITRNDAELIITALLNCFEDSVLGKNANSLFEDLSALLVGGAAMLLFDDGFANCESFIKRLLEQLKVQSTEDLLNGGSIHLLQLNGVYVPYSYVLFNVVDSLKMIERDISSDSRIMRQSNNQLALHNPLSESLLEDVKGLNSSAEKWNTISEYAQNNVTIHFLFMAGMLDIYKNIKANLKEMAKLGF